jgi:predicted transcriptional regulator
VFRTLWGGRQSSAADDPVEAAFGVLERDVMNVLWTEGDFAVRDVQTRLGRRVAYTTVMTTLDRLFKKGVLRRRQSGRAYLYSAALTRPQLQARIAGQVLEGLLQARDGATPVLSNLVESVGSQEGGEHLLESLERMIREKRRQLKRGRSG